MLLIASSCLECEYFLPFALNLCHLCELFTNCSWWTPYFLDIFALFSLGKMSRRLSSKKDKFVTGSNNTCSLLGFTSVYVRERESVCSGFLLSACAHQGVCVRTSVHMKTPCSVHILFNLCTYPCPTAASARASSPCGERSCAVWTQGAAGRLWQSSQRLLTAGC